MQNSKEIGNEPIVASNVSEVKLYRAYSIVDDFKGFSKAKINWFCVERKEPIGWSNDKLIEDYQRGNANQEFGVYEYFVENEIKMLRKFLKQRLNWDLKSIKRTLPIPTNIMPYSLWCGRIVKMNAQGEILHVNATQRHTRLSLFVVDDYDLPFKVKGYLYEI